MAPIRHIVFDIGKVLIHYDPEIPFKRIIPDDTERSWFFENVCTSDWNVEQDRGRTWAEAEAELIAEHPEYKTQIQAFRKYWHEMVPHALEGSVAHLERLLDEGHDVTLLTNFADDTFDHAQEIYPFLKKARGVTVSARVALIKPDPEIYRIHTESFDLEPAATLFIDDSKANVQASRDFGWNAIHFTGQDALDAGFREYGLD